MSPLPIIARQRALSQVGEIRCGGEKKPNAPGPKLESFRLTSQHKEIVERCAELYGGTLTPWQSPAGDAWQLYTDKSALSCMVIVGYSLNRCYERWEGATKCTRRCDGVEEQFSGGPCICNAEGSDACDTITRLMVMLPETGTSLGWKLRSTGEIAADELDGAMMVAEKLAGGRAFVPAILRLTQRRSISDGQTKRYVVPVLDFNLGEAVQQIALPAPVEGEIAGYKPLPTLSSGTSLERGLAVVADPGPLPRNGRSAAPIAAVGESHDFGAAPAVPDVDGETQVGAVASTESLGEPTAEASLATASVAPASSAAAAKPASPSDPTRKPPTVPQLKELNLLVGQMREAGRITTAQLWRALAEDRNFSADAMVEMLAGRDEAGELHWSPLRDSLSRLEAAALITRLEAFEAKQGAIA